MYMSMYIIKPEWLRNETHYPFIGTCGCYCSLFRLFQLLALVLSVLAPILTPKFIRQFYV